MDRGDWQATVHGVARVGHDLATKPPPPPPPLTSQALPEPHGGWGLPSGAGVDTASSERACTSRETGEHFN